MLVQEWAAIPVITIRNLKGTMIRRCQAVIYGHRSQVTLCKKKMPYFSINHLFSERMSPDIPEGMPVKYTVCYVYKYNFDYDNSNSDGEYYYTEYCTRYIYARKCEGKIQFDVSYFLFYNQLCLSKYSFQSDIVNQVRIKILFCIGIGLFRITLNYTRCRFRVKHFQRALLQRVFHSNVIRTNIVPCILGTVIFLIIKTFHAISNVFCFIKSIKYCI
jgi:hypothetical protein